MSATCLVGNWLNFCNISIKNNNKMWRKKDFLQLSTDAICHQWNGRSFVTNETKWNELEGINWKVWMLLRCYLRLSPGGQLIHLADYTSLKTGRIDIFVFGLLLNLLTVAFSGYFYLSACVNNECTFCPFTCCSMNNVHNGTSFDQQWIVMINANIPK